MAGRVDCQSTIARSAGFQMYRQEQSTNGRLYPDAFPQTERPWSSPRPFLHPMNITLTW